MNEWMNEFFRRAAIAFTVIRTVLIEHNLGFHFLVSAHFYLVNKHNFAVLSIFDRYELIILNCISE